MAGDDAILVTCPAGSAAAADPDRIREHLRDGTFFWLDLADPDADELEMLSRDFGVHPLVLEDMSNFGQRPKAEDFDTFLFVVAFGCREDGALEEVHCLLSEGWLVTAHRGAGGHLTGLRDRFARRGRAPANAAMLLHGVLDALVDSFFPALADIDEEVSRIDERLDEAAGDVQHDIFDAKRRLVALNRVAGPQRDLAGRLAGGIQPLPGATPESDRYLRDVYDHTVRIEELTDVYRDLLNGATEVHLSTVSNRLNEVMKQLTVIATVFLPLTFLTGFFGQNFGWMVDHVGGPAPFLLLGVGLQAATVGALLLLFRRRGWI